MKNEELFQKLADAVVDMDEDLVTSLSNQAVEEGVDAFEAIDSGLSVGMERAGKLFEEEEYFVPELLICADAMNAAMDVFSPLIKASDKPKKGRIVIGSIFGDTHDIGKNIVALILSGGGFDVLDLGRDVSAERFVDEAVRYEADIIAISTLMTTTMNNMKAVIDLLQEKGIRNRFKVIIGGKPCSPGFAKRIGADGYSSNAPGALRLVKQLMAETEA